MSRLMGDLFCMGQVIAPILYLITPLQISTPDYILPMSFDKFIQTRTIARAVTVGGSNVNTFPRYKLDSFIDFETDGYLVGIHFMLSHNNNLENGEDAIDTTLPNGAIVAKVSGDTLAIPGGGDITNYSGAQVLISSLEMPNGAGDSSQDKDRNPGSRQTTIAYDADSKRIPIKSNDRLGVHLCTNATAGVVYFRYTLTAYFVRS